MRVGEGTKPEGLGLRGTTKTCWKCANGSYHCRVHVVKSIKLNNTCSKTSYFAGLRVRDALPFRHRTTMLHVVRVAAEVDEARARKCREGVGMQERRRQ